MKNTKDTYWDNWHKKRDMLSYLNGIVDNINREYYVQELFDYHQTHAVYRIYNNPEKILEVKERLKKIGAYKFRVVKNRHGFAIVCFNASKIIIDLS